MKRARSLTGRVTLAAVLATAAVLIAAGLAVIVVSARADRRSIDEDLHALMGRLQGPADRLLPGPKPGPPPGMFAPLDAGPRPELRGLKAAAQQLDPGGDRFARIVTADRLQLSAGTDVPDRFPIAGDEGPETVEVSGEHWRTLATPLPEGGVLQGAINLAPAEARARRLRTIVAVVLLAALALTALAARTMAQLALAPLGALRDAAGRIAATGDPRERMPRADAPTEVDELAGSLDSMLERLEQAGLAREDALAAARRFAADAGHELRTPLTSLQANLATGTPEALEAADRDVERLAALVAQLQALARGEAGPPPRLQEVDLGDLVDTEISSVGHRHPGLRAQLDAVDEVRIQGDPEGLSMLVANLLENAARHGGPEVTVSVARSGTGALVTVDDNGPGIPEHERDAVQERFVRGAGAQGEGSGLGLSIAAAQAARHGGSMALEQSPAGGLRVRVELADLGVTPGT